MLQPLKGIRIVELAGLAPAPFAAMMLADHGAEVIRIERAGWAPPIPPDKDILRRNRAEILTLDLKAEPTAARRSASSCRDADGLIEGFRPGRDGAARARPGRAAAPTIRGSSTAG